MMTVVKRTGENNERTLATYFYWSHDQQVLQAEEGGGGEVSQPNGTRFGYVVE